MAPENGQIQDDLSTVNFFMVPKFLVGEDGKMGARNGVSTGGIEKKMGIHGNATCVMNYDGAKGWLVGEPEKGLVMVRGRVGAEVLANVFGEVSGGDPRLPREDGELLQQLL